MQTKDLKNVCIIGTGLLGGSIGMAVNRVWPNLKRLGYSHRDTTRQRALDSGVVDLCFDNIPHAVQDAQLIILASPIGTFPNLMAQMAPNLTPGAIVTDVGSTKVLPQKWAAKILPKNVTFLGSHPMAGSEQRGVDFARADLFDGANCILTPNSKTPNDALNFLTEFWKMLGMHITTMTPAQHDKVLARISHLPHILAMALVNCSDPNEIVLCGKGFLDTTRIASGPPGVWHDILMTNSKNTADAIQKLIRELERTQKILQDANGKKLTENLAKAQAKRNDLVEKKLLRKELPA